MKPNRYFEFAVSVMSLSFYVSAPGATPLPDNLLLTIDPGDSPSPLFPCNTGSCFFSSAPVWVNLVPGIDGGIVIGTGQQSGGQELGPSQTNTNPGEMTAAWEFFGVYGTLSSLPVGAANKFSAFSCMGSDCIGKTEINTLYAAYNGGLSNLAGGRVAVWQVDVDANGNGSYALEYSVEDSDLPGSDVNLFLRGNFMLPDGLPPFVNDIELLNDSAMTINWMPEYFDFAGDTHSCSITANAQFGNATVNTDCSDGTYTPHVENPGPDMFAYTVTDQSGLSETGVVTVLQVSPLPEGTLLGIDSGDATGSSAPCTTGSCFGVEVAPGFVIWIGLAPGNDEGFVTGKQQLSGGQELAPSPTNSAPGDITAAIFFFSHYGTIFADNGLNIFSDISNDGVTELNDLNFAWNAEVFPIGNGDVVDYSISLDGSGGGNWSLDYLATFSTGQFIGAPVILNIQGSVTIPPDAINQPPAASDVSLVMDSGQQSVWQPDFTDPNAGDTHSCIISGSASHGIAELSADCSEGTYSPDADFSGQDSFSYTVMDQGGLSATANVNVQVNTVERCERDFPIIQVTSVGGGQSPVNNATLSTAFTGHIMTTAGLTTGGRNKVNICPGSTVYFSATSVVGNATCIINSAAGASAGTLAAGDIIVCTNKPDGRDTDRFSIKSGL